MHNLFRQAAGALRCIVLCLLFAAVIGSASAQQGDAASSSPADSDRDGIGDAVEQALLLQFAPTFMVSRQECSSLPAEFVPGVAKPAVQFENGAIYGQVFPAKAARGANPKAEIHFYHLWKQDCGAHGHPLDAEHVSVLVEASGPDLALARWKALYWYAAAHENTLCDVSQITRAATLHAEDRGASVWISAGKHASFFSEAICGRGCGADVCREAAHLSPGRVINLGEPGAPMNGAKWASSPLWPLGAKMAGSDFPADTIARLKTLPDSEIANFNRGRHPMQGAVAISGVTADALANSGQDTANAIAIGRDSTGNALQKSYGKTVHALGVSAHHVGRALGLTAKPKPQSEPAHQ